ncbi:SDR family NAD(P)-dependent oxidoreductase [Streptomyces sp. NPDC048424]|uniref:SDR family NAD(P)-dependent oxidoreductase n=1 Tax=Streptomyces sp. NPDC048424 TaxID=3155265 RepID=UPI00342A0814
MTQNREPAVVTGASSGIGFELARQLAERGFDLIGNPADEERLRAAAEEIGRQTGARVQPVRADLLNYEEAERSLGAVASAGRPVAVAALHAGVGEEECFSIRTWRTSSRSSTERAFHGALGQTAAAVDGRGG